mmetsp:Transcript_18123/g.25152  ORF Transcript_18123/g.25152 Transcript_18123/m.25152 type:complete len:206 (-) Transcript_18123:92-709(-)|eukprot:jgi/Bigna1/131579/aug1.14_g6287
MADDSSPSFSEEQTLDACAYCFDVLINSFDSKHIIPQPDLPKSDFPLFVTWKIYNNRKKYWNLRGCIGTFQKLPLLSGLKDYALTSAFKDSRFNPMSQDEVTSLAVNTSFLTNFEDAKDCFDWEIGTHGITIQFKSTRGRTFSATYLPEVCPEQGWTKEECLESLVRKSGYRGRIDSSLWDEIKLTQYQSVKAKMTYKEYLGHRK